jgi:Salmonella virulence plasmid 65kDa B protein
MIRKPSRPCRAAGFSKRGQRGHRPWAYLARVLLLLLALVIVVLPGCGPSSSPPPPAVPCAPGAVCSGLVVSDCAAPPGLTTPPAAPKPLQAQPDAVVRAVDGGLLAGMGSVSATGEYQNRIPIDAPAGRAGVQPSLAFAYSSRGGNGHLGVGWQLEGLSEINRCAKTFATEGHADGVSFDSNDVFCLDGRKLIAVSGSYGAAGAEYRTEEDSFARITLHRSSQGRIDRFVVRTKEGRIRTYAPPEPALSRSYPAKTAQGPVPRPSGSGAVGSSGAHRSLTVAVLGLGADSGGRSSGDGRPIELGS